MLGDLQRKRPLCIVDPFLFPMSEALGHQSLVILPSGAPGLHALLNLFCKFTPHELAEVTRNTYTLG